MMGMLFGLVPSSLSLAWVRLVLLQITDHPTQHEFSLSIRGTIDVQWHIDGRHHQGLVHRDDTLAMYPRNPRRFNPRSLRQPFPPHRPTP